MLKIALDFAFCLQDLEGKCATEQYPGGHRKILPNMKKEIHSFFHLNSSRSDSGLPDEFGDGQTGSPHLPPVCGAELCPVLGQAGPAIIPPRASWRDGVL